MRINKFPLWCSALLLIIFGSTAIAQEDTAKSLGEVAQGLDTVWVLLGAFLVFFMQAGFGMVESGFIRAKNTCNILTKNFLDFCMASLGFFLIGYAIMFGEGNAFVGLTGWCLSGTDSVTSGIPTYAFWLFQAAFCGAAATIVAGGMAERYSNSERNCQGEAQTNTAEGRGFPKVRREQRVLQAGAIR